jgi:hypothetical protein
MFKHDPEIAAKVESLYQMARGMQRGDTLLWSQIESHLQMTRDEPRMRYIVAKWRKRLLTQDKIETWKEPNVGIRLLHDGECISVVAVKRNKFASRQHTKILKAMGAARNEQLSDNERLMKIAITDHSREARSSARRAAKAGNVSSDRQKLLSMIQQDRPCSQ